MDPINNPTPMQDSGLDAQATGPINPVAPPSVAPATPVIAPAPVMQTMQVPPVNPATPMNLNDAPVAPVAPVMSVPPVAPITPAVSVPPVNPVVNPATLATPSMAETNSQSFGIPVAPTAPVFNSGNSGAINATDPITLPTPSQNVNLAEDELNAPFKAAEPVPGSIGSAISMPVIDGGTQDNVSSVPSVTFNDPATVENPMMNTSAQVKTKKKSNKTTLIALSVIALMVAIALATVLVMQLM